MGKTTEHESIVVGVKRERQDSVLASDTETYLPPTPQSIRKKLPEKLPTGTESTPTRRKRQKRVPLKYRPEKNAILEVQDVTQALLDEPEKVGFLYHALTNSQRIIVVSGAGISVASGIPDFRSSKGIFSKYGGSSGKDLFDINLFRSSDKIQQFTSMIRDLSNLVERSKPSKFHHFINQLAETSNLLRVYTQNIDCLELQCPYLETKSPLPSKAPFPNVIQLHGNIKQVSCTKCHINYPLEANFSAKMSCPECIELDNVRELVGKRTLGHGILKPKIILYNEHHPDGEAIGTISEMDLKSRPDCLIVAGTSLKIPGVKRMVKEFAKAVKGCKGCVIWLNKEPPPTSITNYIENMDLIVVADCDSIPDLVSGYKDKYINKSLKTSTPQIKIDMLNTCKT
ncbi:BA75_04864T0 [Komagataella pastoris]|uniref:BA75_04864T0 n=1 Tax=Komagataella pastoris TaxID=4922 RepID=A0A1B2JIH8_PICPA|nr:BA75_04864T0 [Komagataella pastoris]